MKISSNLNVIAKTCIKINALNFKLLSIHTDLVSKIEYQAHLKILIYTSSKIEFLLPFHLKVVCSAWKKTHREEISRQKLGRNEMKHFTPSIFLHSLHCYLAEHITIFIIFSSHTKGVQEMKRNSVCVDKI